MGQAEKLAPRFKADSNLFFNLVMIGLIVGVVGARLAYAARFPGRIYGAPLSILTPRPVMLDISGGLFAGVLAALIYGQRKKMPLAYPGCNYTRPGNLFHWPGFLAACFGGWVWCITTQVPWGIELWGAVRHPTQIYAILAAMAIAVFIWPRKSRKMGGPWSRRDIPDIFVLISSSRILIETFQGRQCAAVGQPARCSNSGLADSGSQLVAAWINGWLSGGYEDCRTSIE
jgi:phosphatidylglycerol---prolipoprotein diacylglyceryl transferase